MKKIKVSAPGKIHLLGEHAVVYGKPALLAAINKRVFVELIKRKDNKKKIIFTNKSDEKFIDNILYAVDTTAKYYKQKLLSGFTLILTSEIPLGSGLGSSAASAVAIAGAITLLLKQPFDKEKINEIAYLIERHNHGNPSGGDNSVSCYGGFIWYRKEMESFKIIQPIELSLPKNILKNFYLINTGKPKESTGEMVQLVNKFYRENKKLTEKIFINQEQLTKKMLSVFQNNEEEEIKKIIKKGERNLEKLGVVSSSVKKMIRHIEKLGGAAKICGGGGKINSTGVLLVYQNNNINSLYESVSLGEKGVTIHA